MDVEKCCSRCGETKLSEKFINRRNICRDCANKRKKEINKEKALLVTDEMTKTCNTCNETKPISMCILNRNICKDCNNEKRKAKYHNDEEHRKVIIQQVCISKHNKAIERQRIKLEEIGENNKKCSNCDEIKPMCRFRHNRLKCKDCERDEPLDKFKRKVRSRIYVALKRNKEMHTIKYLGSNSIDYLQWILHNDKDYTLENQGKVWHIDHVIPLSTFDLENKEEQLIAFNWRNTMPLAANENMKKNNKIISSQIEQHYRHLIEYHKEKNIEIPQQFIDLFAKYLVAGIP